MGCCHGSHLLLDGEEGCSGNLVQVISKRAHNLIRLSYLLRPASVQHYNQEFLQPEPNPFKLA
jgi:hypothetical protein